MPEYPYAYIRPYSEAPLSARRTEWLDRPNDFERLPMGQVRGVVIHHTVDNKDVDQIVDVFRLGGHPTHYFIDRKGAVFQTLPSEIRGDHIRSTDKFSNSRDKVLSDANTIGIEISAFDDTDVQPQQILAAKRLIHWLARAPRTETGFDVSIDPIKNVYAHPELNPDKTDTEGMTVINAIRGAPKLTLEDIETLREAALTPILDVAGRHRDGSYFDTVRRGYSGQKLALFDRYMRSAPDGEKRLFRAAFGKHNDFHRPSYWTRLLGDPEEVTVPNPRIRPPDHLVQLSRALAEKAGSTRDLEKRKAAAKSLLADELMRRREPEVDQEPSPAKEQPAVPMPRLRPDRRGQLIDHPYLKPRFAAPAAPNTDRRLAELNALMAAGDRRYWRDERAQQEYRDFIDLKRRRGTRPIG